MYKVKQWILISDYSMLKNTITDEEKRIGSHDFLVLLLLCENSGNIVHKQKLLEYAWAGKHVSEGSVAQAISNIRNVIDDNGKDQKHLKTIPKIGYKLDSCVVEIIDEPTFDSTPIEEKAEGKILSPDTSEQEKNTHDTSNAAQRDVANHSIGNKYSWLHSWQFISGVICLLIAFIYPSIRKHDINAPDTTSIIVPETITDSASLTMFWDNKERGEIVSLRLLPYIEELQKTHPPMRLVIMRVGNTLSLVILKEYLKPINVIFMLNSGDDVELITQLIKDEIQYHEH
ncbi:Transcriptional activator ToxR [Moritella sp. JT01]|uniref:transcriptional regulator n=1 Tax=Moritella sp. JT01 TaxID=756698 RepID=UPI00079B5F80|nr:winged helix-turn-helix domain-containing protein [Moritella sp. JT01]KXO08995.1 Transcriptional activator ToxR [Moritella sp. JT01]